VLFVDLCEDFLSDGGKPWLMVKQVAEQVRLIDHLKGLRVPVDVPDVAAHVNSSSSAFASSRGRLGSAYFPHKSNAVESYYHLTCMDLPTDHQSRTSRPTGDGDHSMKNLILAVFAALSLTAAVVPVASAHSSVAGDAQATRMQQTGAYSG
jgi:hypothetical protein